MVIGHSIDDWYFSFWFVVVTFWHLVKIYHAIFSARCDHTWNSRTTHRFRVRDHKSTQSWWINRGCTRPFRFTLFFPHSMLRKEKKIEFKPKMFTQPIQRYIKYVYDEWWDNGFHVYYVIQYCFFWSKSAGFLVVLFLFSIESNQPMDHLSYFFPVRFHRLHYITSIWFKTNRNRCYLYISCTNFSFVSNFNLAPVLTLFISMAMSTWYRRCQLISGIEFISFFYSIKSRKPTHNFNSKLDF